MNVFILLAFIQECFNDRRSYIFSTVTRGEDSRHFLKFFGERAERRDALTEPSGGNARHEPCTEDDESGRKQPGGHVKWLFFLRRKLITCNRGRKTTAMSAMTQEICPTIFTASAVSCRYSFWLKAIFKNVITK